MENLMKKKENEFLVHERLKLKVNRNDFDELGSIIEIQLNSINNSKDISNIIINNNIIISFYNQNQLQIEQKDLIILTNNENTFFDNVLILRSSNTENILLKLLNKEIYYIKIYTSTFLFNIKKGNLNLNTSCSSNILSSLRLFDAYKLVEINLNFLSNSQFTLANLNNNISNNIEKNEHINLILQELNGVNLSLINEKEQIEKNKIILKNKEDQIYSLIIAFKKEIMIYSDKFYTEAFNKFNCKLNEVQKKLQITENNVMNKYKIIKDKVGNGNSNSNNISYRTKSNSTNETTSKEKLANLEIKIKLLEDTINNLKLKLNEKEYNLKLFNDSEEKQIKLIKKLKDENFNLQIKIKNNEEKTNNLISQSLSEVKAQDKDTNSTKELINNTTKSNKVANKESKQNPKKFKHKFEFNKILVNQYTEYFILDLLVSSNKENKTEFSHIPINDKDISICSNIILNICINPINLFQKFPFSYVFAIRKISNYVLNNLNKNLLRDNILDLINHYPEVKRMLPIMDSKINKIENDDQEFIPLLSLIKNEICPISLNQILLQKLNYFCTYIDKAEKKYLEKNTYANYKIISLSIVCLKLVFISDYEEVISILQYVLNQIIFAKDFFSINYLLFSLNFFEIFVLLINLNNMVENKMNHIFNLFLDSFLFLYSLDKRYNIFEHNKHLADIITENKSIVNFVTSGVNNYNKKIIIFAGILSNYAKNIIKINCESKNIIDDEVIIKNLNKII